MATKNMGICVDEIVQTKFKKNIKEEYGKIKGIYGNEVENAMKFYLAANGNKKYQKDPDVLAIFKKAKKRFEEEPAKTAVNESLEERIDTKLETLKEEILAQFEKKTRRESSKKHGHAEFKKQFQMAFQDYHQVSKHELEQFIMNQADIVDKRAVQNRIQYLLSRGVLESFAPNVYNIK